VPKVPEPETVRGFELRIVKNADRADDVLDGAIAAIGAAIFVISDGWFGWGPDITRARWLVEVHGRGPDDFRIVGTSLTLRGARRRSRKVRDILVAGDRAAIDALPDLDY